MTFNQQYIAVFTLVRRELTRMLRTYSQIFLPPVITTLLYFLIFGQVVGERIGSMQGGSYALFIAPGLIMMSVITNAYANVSSSLFIMRFQKSIEELLVSPMHYSLLLLGFIFAGVIRGVVVAILVFLVSTFFVTFNFNHLPMALLVIVLVATVFSLAGFTNGMLAQKFDDVAIVPTFVLAPLTYLGGVFYAASMLSPFWQHCMSFNPIFYMVSALRATMTGHHEINMLLAISIISLMLIILVIVNLVLLKKGVGIRD